MIGSRMTGAEITSLSSTMAKRLPDILGRRLRELARAGRVEAEADDRLAGALVEARLRVGQVAAGNQHLLLDDVGRLAAPASSSALRNPAAPCPARPDRADTVGSTMRKSILAVLPSSSFSRVGSCRPGTCTRMRSSPWRWISGSTVPSSLTRRSTIWIDCSTDWRMRSVIAAGGTVSRISPPPASLTSRLRWPLEPSRPPSGCDSSRSLVSAVWQIGFLGDAHFDVVAAHREPGIGDLGFAQHAAHVVADLIELVLLDRVGIDLEQDVRAALQIEAEHQMALRPFRPGLDRALRGRSSERRKGTPPAPSG